MASKLRRWHRRDAFSGPPEKRTKDKSLKALEFLDADGNVVLRIALTADYTIHSERKLILLDHDSRTGEFKLMHTSGLLEDFSKVASIRMERKP